MSHSPLIPTRKTSATTETHKPKGSQGIAGSQKEQSIRSPKLQPMGKKDFLPLYFSLQMFKPLHIRSHTPLQNTNTGRKGKLPVRSKIKYPLPKPLLTQEYRKITHWKTKK